MNTPIVDFVKKYADDNALRLHMPGHKGKENLGFEKYDITEIDGADVLYSANGIIAQSQKNAAILFDTKKTLYSTEGSSLCIRAMLYILKAYALQMGRKPIIAAARNVHKSFVSAAAILDIDVEWLLPQTSESIITCDITAEFLENYLKVAKQKPIAVYITSPDYLGNIANIKSLSAVCHKYGVLLVDDNAHGAYLKFLKQDKHPISLGADMCCDSAHKTLPVLTGGAYLHISKQAPDFLESNAVRALSLFASTSPSYLIMQSLDAANKYIAEGYSEKLAIFIDNVTNLKKQLTKNGYTLCGDEPLKITILTKPYGYKGNEIAQLLLKEKIVCEFYDADYIVFMVSIETGTKGLEKIKEALLSIDKKEPIFELPPKPTLKKVNLSLTDALYVAHESKNVDVCLGKTLCVGETICPPAIPIVLPGEEIDDCAIEAFKYYGITKCSVVK